MTTRDQRLVKGEEKRERIILAAIHIIAKDGLKSLSAQHLATASGMSKSNLFHHFENLDALIYAAYTTIATQISNQIFPKLNKASLEDFIFGLGSQVFELDERDKPIYLALMQFYQLALVDGDYAQRLLSLKEAIGQSIEVSLQEWAHERLSGSQADRFCRALKEVVDPLTMTLDALGMYAMMHKNPDHYSNIWRLQANLYADYLRRHYV